VNNGRPGRDPAGPTTVHAAGSLKAAFTEVGALFESDTGQPPTLHFGAAGLLRDRLLAGEPSSLFASANLAHPQALAAAGRGNAVCGFARNRLCLLVAPGFKVDSPGLALHLLDPDVRLGTSTPGADPSGDYAWQLFDRIEAAGSAPPGSAAALKAKALQLTGRGDKAAAADARSLYGTLVATGQADAFVTYRTNARQACADFPELRMLDLPEAWAVDAPYGLIVLEAAPAGGQAFADLLLGPQGQAVLRAHGFEQP
jgi:molybdate transport system substrate-binding protein